jgi:hypothetical protein
MGLEPLKTRVLDIEEGFMEYIYITIPQFPMLQDYPMHR